MAGDPPVNLSKRRGKMHPVLRVSLSLLFCYAVVILFMAGCQRHMIYYPARATEADLRSYAADTGVEPWLNRSGQLIGWKSPLRQSAGPEARVVVFHGNAGFALNRVFYYDGIRRARGDRWRVYIFEYPGYGARDGKPGEERFLAAAHEAIAELAEQSGAPIILVGESLGSGVATQIAAEFPDSVAGLILITPFSSLPDVGARHYPWLPVRWLMSDRYDNVEALRAYNGPVAIVLAENDQVVPADLGKKLYASYRGPKRLWLQRGRDHNDLDLTSVSPFWTEVCGFIEKN